MKTNKFHLIFFFASLYSILCCSFSPCGLLCSLLLCVWDEVWMIQSLAMKNMRRERSEAQKKCLCKQFTPSHSCSRLCLTAADWGCSFLLCFCSFSPEKSPPIRQQHCHPLFYRFLPQERTLDSSHRISMHSQSRTLPHSSFAQHHIFICCSLYSDHNWISMNDEDAFETSSMFLEGIACCC